MLEKIVVVLVGVVASIVGALSPEAMFASHPAHDAGLDLSSTVTDATLATFRTTDGSTFAKLNILWAEVDGHRVTDDAWGTGEVKELKFKVGVKNVDGMALAVGDKRIPLHPTDVLTVRKFSGDFSYRGMGTPAATLQLQGTVKTTLLNEGAARSALRTQNGQLTPATAPPAADANSIAYVVLDSGEKLQTVDVASGGQRVFTQDAPSASAGGTILVRWIKIDGQVVHDYAAGSGVVGAIEFQPADANARAQMLSFDGSSNALDANARVTVQDFVGDYVVSQVGGGLSKVRLDGFAGSMTTGSNSPLPKTVGANAPLASFTFTPPNPTTTDTIAFHDQSSDAVDGGIIVFHRWDFGDGTTAVVPEPTHRFTVPGSYDVVLNVTDNDLNTGEIHQVITVRNTNPIPDFDFAPKTVTTQTLVAFTDHSMDPDGRVVSRTWDFGDGSQSTETNPTHRFQRPGSPTVTLTVVDDLGGANSLSKVVPVRDTPPLSGFTFTPARPLSGVPVQFLNETTDPDGSIVNYSWTFGDGQSGTGSAPTHAFAAPGVYTVSLTVTDDFGATDTASTQIIVQNRPPLADFNASPLGEPASVPVTFTSASRDVDGSIVLTTWDFGDGSGTSIGTVATHTFPRAGTYDVTLTVTDNTLAQSSLTRSITIANAAPIVSFNSDLFIPRNVTRQFVDSSRDPDGDPITQWTWDFGDGTPPQSGKQVLHTFTTLGNYTVTLRATDNGGHQGQTARTVQVLNSLPAPFLTLTPAQPIAGQPTWVNASASDADSNGPFAYRIEYDGGAAPDTNASQQHVFPLTGPTTVTITVTDPDGGSSAPLVKRVTVGLAVPVANWMLDHLPTEQIVVNFTDASTSANGPIKSWAWDFGDGTTSNVASPSHTWASPGAFDVKLIVKDSKDVPSPALVRTIHVNARPVASVSVPSKVFRLNEPVQFTNLSFDRDSPIVWSLWNFGDGTSSTTEPHDPIHAYSLPGPHAVTLIVRDDQGAYGSTVTIVNIANQLPVARWDVVGPTPPKILAGQTLHFTSTSFDPENQPLTNTNWTFGDGTFGTGPEIDHVYPRSGIYRVALNVSDGVATSNATIRDIRVGVAHPLTLTAFGVQPDGALADLPGGEFHLTLTVGRGPTLQTLPVAGTQFFPNATNPRLASITLPEGTWFGGDQATLRVDSPFLNGLPLQSTVTLEDTSGLLSSPTFAFQIPLPLKVTLHADAGRKAFDIGLPVNPLRNDSTNSAGEPVYRDMLEPFHGTGTVLFADGRSIVPGHGVPDVAIEARYLPLKALMAPRDSALLTDGIANNNFAIGWCQAGTATVADDGTYTWSFDGSGCVSSAASVYPVGRWEVRAKATFTFANAAKSDVQEIFVDPTGGLLWSSSAPP